MMTLRTVVLGCDEDLLADVQVESLTPEERDLLQASGLRAAVDLFSKDSEKSQAARRSILRMFLPPEIKSI